MEMLSRVVTPEGIKHITVLPGWTAQQLIDQNTDTEIRPFVVAFNHGVEIRDPVGFHVQHGDNIILCLVPAGGGGGRKGSLGAILSIAVSVFAWQMAPMLTASMFGEAAALNTLGGATMLTNIVGAGISFVGHAMLSALIRPPSIKSTPSKQGGTTYSFGGVSNQANPYGAVLRLYGRHQVFPKIAANPLINNVGKNGVITALYDFGLGWIELENIKIGDVAANIYEPELVFHTNSYCRDMQFMPSRVGYDQMNYELQDGQPLILRTKSNAIGAAVDISFPQGMFVVDNQGTSQGSRSTRVQIRVMYRRVGETAWVPLPASAYDNDNATSITQSVVTQESKVNATVSCSRGTFTIVDAVPPGNLKNPGDVTLRDGRVVRTYQAYSTVSSGVLGGTTTAYTGPRYVVVPSDWIWGNPAASGQPPYPLGGAFTTNARWVQPYSYTPSTVANFVELYGKVEQPFTLNVSMDFQIHGDYEVYIERIGNFGGGTKWDRYTDSVVTLIKSFQKGAVVNLDRRHTMLELRLRATNKLSGVINNLSAIGTSVLRQTADGINFTEAPSRNPAWIAIDLLTSETNARPVPDHMIDWASWIQLAAYCDQPIQRVINGVPVTTPRHQADFVLDSFTTAKELLESLLSGCRASLRIDGAGRYSVLQDAAKHSPRQVITPENSWNFHGSRTFTDEIHALRVQFIDGNRPDGTAGTWNPGEVICYADGYNASNARAENIEELQTFGITDYASAWAYGRYMLAQGIIRNEQFSVVMGIDNLVCARGDLVWVAHDVPQIGGVAGRVTEVIKDSIRISTPISVAPTAYSVRIYDGTVKTGSIVSATPDGVLVLDNATGISQDDLIVVGMMSRVTQPYLVQQITPDRDLTATLTLVKYDAAVYTADVAGLPSWSPGFGDDLVNTTNLAVTNLTATHSLRFENRYPINDFVLNWDLSGFGYDHADVYVTYAGGKKEFLGSTQYQTYRVIVDLGTNPERLGYVKFEVLPISVTGINGTGASAVGEVVRDTVAPFDPQGFTVNLQDMTTVIFWDQSVDVDIDYYELRYSPDVVTGSWNASQLVEYLPYNVIRTSVGSRTGIYFLQATDTSGNKSGIVWQRTTVEYLPNVNQILSVNDAPGGWGGSMSNTELVNGHIQLVGDFGAIEDYGYYYFNGFVDLTDIYEVRVSSKLLGHGVHATDLMVDWTPMAEARPLSMANASDWNIRLEYRTANQVEVMDDWLTLDDPICNPLQEDYTQGYWSVWRPLEVSDITARLIQFRVKMESFNTDVRPVLIDGLVEVDAVDRIWRKNNIPVPIGGTRVLYDPPFMDKPTVAVSMEATTAIRYEMTNLNRQGFDIKLFDATAAVAGQIDVSALGMGREKLNSI